MSEKKTWCFRVFLVLGCYNMMDVFETLENEFDEYFDRITAPRRNPVFHNRTNYMETLDETDFRTRFRLTKEAVMLVYSMIEETISAPTDRNHAVKPITRLLLTLRFYATGSFLTVVGDFSGVSKASASRFVNLVSKAIARFRPEFIKFPTNTQEIQQEFYNIAKFPRLIGAIDCTHVPIKSPGGDNAEEWRDRKSQFSFNVQTVVSEKLKILDIVARWPGAAHDQTIFNNSFIKQRLINGEFGNLLIVGDKGYENTSYLLTPLQNPMTPAEHLYNESQIRSRNVVERTYGVWKNRFPILSKKVLLHVSRVQAVIVACAVLHNIAIDMRDEHFELLQQVDEPDDDIDRSRIENVGNARVRSNLINDYFALLL